MASITDIVMRPAHASLIAILFVASCATAPPPGTASDAAFVADATPDPAPFSATGALDALPAGWKPFRVARFKKLTDYRLVAIDGKVALQAVADGSASGLHYETSADLNAYPWLTWKWKVRELNGKADNTLAHVEDSPARVIVVFEGGREALPEAERLNYDLAKAMSGNPLPYATIMYIWENHLPEGAIISHHFTTRVKMIVASNGDRQLGAWHRVRVNVLEDYRRAFEEDPPRVKAVGVMSDSDNTGERTVAWYGDIRFQGP